MANEQKTPVVKGIVCPACGTVENYAGIKKERQPDNSIKYRKQCKACGSYFETVEIPLGVVEVSRRNRSENSSEGSN